MRTDTGRLAATLATLTFITIASSAHAGDLSSSPRSEKGGAGEQTYLTVELKNVQITSYQLGVLDNSAAEVAIETLIIAHEEVRND